MSRFPSEGEQRAEFESRHGAGSWDRMKAKPAAPASAVEEVEALEAEYNANYSVPDTTTYAQMRAKARDLARQLDAARAERQKIAKLCGDLGERVIKAEAENEALRKHTERYRWLREHFRFANDTENEIWFDASIHHSALKEQSGSDLDVAIDAAMSDREK